MPRHLPVAITGIGCRFPGGVADVRSFWRAVAEGINAVSEIPESRITIEHFFDPRPATPGRMMTRWGGFLTGIDQFDASFFGLSPLEAERMDPQQRLLLETAWEALEDAGENAALLEGTKAGVFVGQWLSDFESRLFADPERVDFFMTTGSGRYAASGRIAYVLGTRGPTMTIDCACASSLAAIHLAVRSVQNGESSVALAGGANVILQPHISIAYSQSRMMAPDGKCKFGDARGDGYVRSEGAAMVVLKPLQAALDAGDRVYAVIRGSAVNNDGRGSGSLGTPSQTGQEALLREAYADAEIDPARVGYIEAHGTGTRAGDPVEIGALASVLAPRRQRGERMHVGSVKTNFGHTEGAAGVAGLIKATLALHHRTIPASLHLTEPNPAIAWADIPFDIPRETVPWTAASHPRVAGVSAFGIAGTNAHVVLEEAPVAPAASSLPDSPTAPVVLPLSARSDVALRALAGAYADLLDGASPPSLGQICWNAATRRTALENRCAFVASDRATMSTALRAFADGGAALAEGVHYEKTRPRVAFVCPGQGAQWTGMVRELLATNTTFRDALAECDRAARPHITWSIVEQIGLDEDQPGYLLDRIDVIQPVLVAVAIAYAAVLRALGVEPDAIVGHSMGEAAAAHLAGVIDLPHAMQIICERSALMRRASGTGAMALVDLPRAEVRQRIAQREHEVSVAVSNSPRSCVISGTPEAVTAVLAELEGDGVFCRKINVDVASHSPQMEPLAGELVSRLGVVATGHAAVPLYSSVLARTATGPEFNAAYWGSNLRSPVLFGDTIAAMVDDGIRVFVELGPHPVLLTSIEQTAQHRNASAVTIACARREEPDAAGLMTAIAQMFCAGYPVEWSRIMARQDFCALPLYPWQRERHWATEAEVRDPRALQQPVRDVPADTSWRDWLYAVEWSERTPTTETGKRRWILIGDRGGTAAALGAKVGRDGENHALIAPDADIATSLTAALDAARHARESVNLIFLRALDVEAAFNDGLARELQSLSIAVSVVDRAARGVDVRLWAVTRNAVRTGNSDAADVTLAQAPFRGLGSALRAEHGDVWRGIIDVGSESPDEAATELRAAILSGGQGDRAVRASRVYEPQLVRASLESPGNVTLRRDATYLITGGLGGIGTALAAWLVERGARHLLVLGRTPLPPRREWAAVAPTNAARRGIDAVRSLEALGAHVRYEAVDVGDAAQLSAFIDDVNAEAGPPIRGVFHAAGVVEDHLVRDMDDGAFARVLHAKVRGGENLDRAFPDLDHFVLFSSMAVPLAEPGQGSYAAANAFLDALAVARHGRGQAALTVAWGPWSDTGMMSGDVGRRKLDDLEAKGIRAFSSRHALEVLGAAMAQRLTNLVVIPIDWTRLRQSATARANPLIRTQLTGDVADARDVAASITASDAGERQRAIGQIVRDSIARVLKLSAATLDVRKPFGTMGLTSLLALELRNKLERELGRPLSATLAWNYPTVEKLTAHLAGEQSPAAAAEDSSSAAPASATANAADVASISDDEAARLLRSRRRA